MSVERQPKTAATLLSLIKELQVTSASLCVSRARRATLSALMTGFAAILLVAGSAAPAHADYGIEEFSTRFLEQGKPATRAGSHPDMETVITFTERLNPATNEVSPEQQMREVVVDLPPGFYGDPTATPQCKRENLAAGATAYIVPVVCPPDTQVGTILVVAPGKSVQEAKEDPFTKYFHLFPVYNMEPIEGETGVLAASVLGVPVNIQVTPRTDGDNGLQARIRNIDTHLNIHGTVLTLWGVPASSSHDEERVLELENFEYRFGAVPGADRRPFITLPARCDAPVATGLAVRSWQQPDRWLTATDVAPTLAGCNQLKFNPDISVKPVSDEAGAPSGYDVELSVPQDTGAESVATPQLRDAVVTMPEGVSISPSSATGLEGCSDAKAKLGTREEPDCPDGSKIGSISIDTPLLPDPLDGDVFLRSPKPGELFRLLLVARGLGMVLKVPGVVRPDPATGQLTTTFADNPQLPFNTLHLHFNGGPRAALRNPTTCGPKEVTARLTSWAGHSVDRNSTFNIGSGCESPRFKPSVDAGVVDPEAASSSAFVLRVQRADTENELKTVKTTLPPGLLAKVGGVPLCKGTQAAAGSCPADSLVGRVSVGAGAGSSPYYVTGGKVYLTEGYKGGAYGMLFTVPAVAGPFDLGTVNVRAALNVDPVTAQVTVDADPMPRILEGVPLDVRDLRVGINRDGFVRTPTNCSEMKVDTTLGSYAGDSADVPTRFQVGDCASLGFKPKLSLKLSGPTHRSAHPALRAVLKARKGDANIGKAVVTLPKTEFLENAHIETVCTRVQYAAHNCPKGSVYGYAKAWSPLLDKPLQGPVYLRSSDHQLPDLVASLDGQIHLDLAGRIDSVNERLRTTFWAVPDAPVSKFVLRMKGGNKSLLVNNRELCQAKPRATVAFTGHNGKHRRSNPLVRTDCGKKNGH